MVSIISHVATVVLRQSAVEFSGLAKQSILGKCHSQFCFGHVDLVLAQRKSAAPDISSQPFHNRCSIFNVLFNEDSILVLNETIMVCVCVCDFVFLIIVSFLKYIHLPWPLLPCCILKKLLCSLSVSSCKPILFCGFAHCCYKRTLHPRMETENRQRRQQQVV